MRPCVALNANTTTTHTILVLGRNWLAAKARKQAFAK
jgi:hypothetical protein